MLNLPKNFHFNQSSLHEFKTCKRLFRYRYIDKIEWPAVEAEPVIEWERRAKLGADFHKALQQFFIGIPVENIKNHFENDLISKWWNNFERSLGKILKEEDIRIPEMRLVYPIEGQQLIAKLDLFIVKPDGKRIIVDWKTSQKRPRQTTLKNHMQSRVYPFLLVCTGEYVYPRENFSPEQLEMVYWFSEHPDQPEIFSYSEKQFLEDQNFFIEVISEVTKLAYQYFNKTEDHQRCRYCVYRSLCDRGIEAGDITDIDEIYLEDSMLEKVHEFDKIPEIEY